MLITTAVLAVLSAGAMLALRPGADATTGDMARFEATFAGQRALAIEGHDRRGLRLRARDMQVTAWRQGGWQDMGPALTFRRNVQIDVGRSGDAPQIVIDADGRSTAFTLLLSDGARCVTDGWGALACTR